MRPILATALLLLLALPASTTQAAHASCHGEACAGGVSLGIRFTMTIVESAALSIDTRETGIDGVAIVDVEAGGQGVRQVKESALVIAGSSPLVIRRDTATDDYGKSVAQIRWDLPPDALAWRIPEGQDAIALAWIERALKHKAPRTALAIMLQKAWLPEGETMLAGVR
jgi:hypothetical protein